ncbi:MAG: hypothetical protein AAF560_03965 [Acidobacteriota bacterium]
MTKEERKELLAQLERQSSRTVSSERILQRGEQALKNGQLDQAKRVLQQLQGKAAILPGLELFKQRVEAAVQAEKQQTNLRATEEMLTRYIQQRKKPLAKLALTTLVEMAPNHPRRTDYTTWVADLDEEVELQRRADELLAAGRAAVISGDFSKAAKHLGTLNKVDPGSRATEQLERELAQAQQGEAESADIERAKQRLEELLANGELDAAEQQMEQLGQMDLPKVTIDFWRKRLQDHRSRVRDEAEAAELITAFEGHLAVGAWPSAREVAQRFSQRFPTSPRGAALFSQVNDHEAAQRRQQSLDEGLATLERFIGQGDRHNAELALKLLANLDLEPERLAQLEARVRSL